MSAAVHMRLAKALKVVAEQASAANALDAVEAMLAQKEYCRSIDGTVMTCTLQFRSGLLLTGAVLTGGDRKSAKRGAYAEALAEVWPMAPHVLLELLDKRASA